MAKKLDGYYTFNDPDSGESKTFGPDDQLPDWAAKVAEESDHVKYEGDASEDSAADLPVAGPGQVAGEGMSDEEKAEARRAADRQRKARQRADAKTKAESDAEAVRKAEEAEKARAAAEQNQGGGS